MVRGQVVDKISSSLGSHGVKGRAGETSSAPKIVPTLSPLFGFHGDRKGFRGLMSD